MRTHWLSHFLNTATPAYGGDKQQFSATMAERMDRGDSCNSLNLAFSNHIGTHVDVPFHFLPDGMTLDQYDPAKWVFSTPYILDLAAQDNQVIDREEVEGHVEHIPADVV